MTIRVVAVGDTHGYHEDLVVPDGDLFIHAGDLTQRGTLEQLSAAAEWIGSLPHAVKIVIAGNHDWLFQLAPDDARSLFADFIYLEDEGVEIEGMNVWGSPWQPEFFNWAFNLPRGEALREVWKRIPQHTDILVTHGPPFGFGDRVGERREGCEDLLDEVVSRVKPALHLYGHIHEDRGEWVHEGIRFANVTSSECRLEPTLFDLEQLNGQWIAKDVR